LGCAECRNTEVTPKSLRSSGQAEEMHTEGHRESIPGNVIPIFKFSSRKLSGQIFKLISVILRRHHPRTTMTIQEAPVQVEAPSLYRHAIMRGVALGLLAMLLTVSAYVIDYTMIASFKFIGPFLCLCIAMVIVSGIQYRKDAGGYLSYQKAFTHGMVVFMTYGVVSTLFNIALYNVIDIDLPQKMADEMSRTFGVSQSADQFKPLGLLWNLVKVIPGYAIIALLTALIVKKNVPLKS
jgi:hypothetical protein